MDHINDNFHRAQANQRAAYFHLTLLIAIIGFIQWKSVWHPSWVYLKDDENGEPKVIYGLFEVCSKISGQCRKFTDHTIDTCVGYGAGNTMDGFRCTEWKILRVVAEMNVFFVFLLFCGSILTGYRLGPYTDGWRIFQFFIAAMFFIQLAVVGLVLDVRYSSELWIGHTLGWGFYLSALCVLLLASAWGGHKIVHLSHEENPDITWLSWILQKISARFHETSGYIPLR
ncbi:hypothetical protein BKA57DRAFT_442906 [Linnemannia elongata]|nr:hypothetical protein BKA57DRAFT_442906 [Linnemannia elongata]